MKKDRQLLEDALNLVIKDYSNNNKIIEDVTNNLIEKGMPLGKVGGLFTQVIPLSYISEIELCLFTKYLYEAINEYKIRPDKFFNESELDQSELYHFIGIGKTNKIILHNVDQINEYQWLCTKETYQNVAIYFENGLLTYNPKTQRQPLKRKVGNRIVETINIDPKKISEIKEEMLNNTFNTNAIILNVRRINGMEKIKYDAKNRNLIIEVDNDSTKLDVIDGFHRLGAMLKVVEEKPEIDRLTSIYIYHVDEEKARQVIRQESKATPIDEEWIDVMDVSNPNMEVAKSINSKQRMNEMFNRIGLDNNELKREGKLVTFETLSKTIEFIFDLKTKPFIEAQNVEKFLIELFNIIIGVHHSQFNENLNKTKELTYLADNNTFIGYIALGHELQQRYPEQWQDKLKEIIETMDLNKPNDILKKAGLENNINLSTIKKIAEYFKSLIRG